jgi:hypothetical protein
MHSISRLVASGYVTRAAPFGTPLSGRGCYSHVGGETLPPLTDMQKKGFRHAQALSEGFAFTGGYGSLPMALGLLRVKIEASV